MHGLLQQSCYKTFTMESSTKEMHGLLLVQLPHACCTPAFKRKKDYHTNEVKLKILYDLGETTHKVTCNAGHISLMRHSHVRPLLLQ